MTETLINNLTEYGYSYCTPKKNKKHKIVLVNKFMLYLSLFRLKKVAKKLDYSDVIEKKKDLCGGKAVLKGTRITVETIYNILTKKMKKKDNLKYCIKELKKEYPALVEEKQILMSIIYYIGHTKIKNI